MPSLLEQEILRSVRYFQLFDMPVTATQVWRSLVLGEAESRTRWEGRHLPGLGEIQQTLRDSQWLKGKVGTRWGYYFLNNEQASVRRRLTRHGLAQRKWKVTRKVVRWLAYMPFVEMIAGSGSLAAYNTKPESDLDLFVVARAKRIWTARFFLLLAAQLTGRRRKYWNRKAPDMVCMNHYVTDDAMVVPSSIRNLYTAVLYTHLAPMFGSECFATFQQVNAGWIRQYLMYPEVPALLHKLAPRVSPTLLWLRRLLESFLFEPIGDVFEGWLEKIQRRMVVRHTVAGQGGRVALSDTELAFHPDTKVPDILRAFEQDPAQGRLL